MNDTVSLYHQLANKMPQSELKTAKGTRDWVGRDLLLRDHILYA